VTAESLLALSNGQYIPAERNVRQLTPTNNNSISTPDNVYDAVIIKSLQEITNSGVPMPLLEPSKATRAVSALVGCYRLYTEHRSLVLLSIKAE